MGGIARRGPSPVTVTLPTFVVVGAMRSGTTALARHLGAHPQIHMAAKKEIHFFDRHFHRGVGWYRSHFEAGGSALAWGEATPAYLYDPVAAPRMAEVIPQARLVAILRNPVDRAYSHYWHKRARGSEALEFGDAVAAEPERLRTGGYEALANFSYVDRGKYAGQLRRLSDHFPRDSIRVLLFEEYRTDPATNFADLCTFLGVDAVSALNEPARPANQFTRFRSDRLRQATVRLPAGLRRIVGRLNQIDDRYPPMDPVVRDQLKDTFAPHNAELASWLGRDLAVWGD